MAHQLKKVMLSAESPQMRACKPVSSQYCKQQNPKVIQTKANLDHRKENGWSILNTKSREKESRWNTRTRSARRPTIPLFIIQSNFGEELQVEAGLPSFMHRWRVQIRVHLGGKQSLRQTHFLSRGAVYRPGNSVLLISKILTRRLYHPQILYL